MHRTRHSRESGSCRLHCHAERVASSRRQACNVAGYLLAFSCVASVAEWSRRLSVAQEITGSNPVARPKQRPGAFRVPVSRSPAPVAQWIEHWASDPGVAGSSPAGRAISLSCPHVLRFPFYAERSLPDSPPGVCLAVCCKMQLYRRLFIA